MKNSKYILAILLGMSLASASPLALGKTNTSTNKSSNQNSSSTSQTVSDSTITTKVKAKFLKNSLVSAFDISVTTDNGIVKLAGNVDSDAQFEQAVILAQNTDGVKDVDSSGLKVKASTQPMDDTLITAKVKGLLIKNSLFTGDENQPDAWPIHVETKEGVVYLTGKVKNDSQMTKAVDTAKSVKGVKDVKSSLTVDSSL